MEPIVEDADGRQMWGWQHHRDLAHPEPELSLEEIRAGGRISDELRIGGVAYRPARPGESAEMYYSFPPEGIERRGYVRKRRAAR